MLFVDEYARNFHLELSMCCDKNDTIRVLSLYLKETQDQYNDCLSEAAEQGTLMELQRDAIQKLQRTIARKDLVYYSLLIKAQELFRGHVQDVRIVKSKMDNMVRAKRYLEDKYRRVKRLWQQAEQELKGIKSASLCNPQEDSNTTKESQCKDCSTWTDAVEFADSQEIQKKINFLLRENEDLKKQLCGRSIDFDLFDQQVKNQLDDNNRVQELARVTNDRLLENENCLIAEKNHLEFVLKEHFSYLRILIAELQHAREREILKTDSSSSDLRVDIDTDTIKDELNRKHSELDKLLTEAKDKEEELGMLQDMRKEFERTEGLEKMNECLKRELTILRRTAESNDCYSGENARVIRHSPSDEVDDRFCICQDCKRPKKRESEMMRELKNQLSSTKGLTEECLEELRFSKEMRERICSLKRLLKEKSDEMAKLQADHQIMKNDYSILKSENGIFEEKAREEIREFREKLKTLHSELRLVDDNYQRVSQDFDKSQELLIQAARREVDLQHAITAMEQIFYAKLTSAEKEAKRLSDLVDMLRSELENSRDEFAAREEDFTERYRDACKQIENLEGRVSVLETTKHQLSRQLQETRQENYSLIEENTRLTESGCRCVKELEDTHNALLELKGECKAKSKTLDCVSAELISVATSRTEICDESQHVVSCIRAWMDEQRRLVETLSKKLKEEKNRIAQLTFEKKALVATVRELMRLNKMLSGISIRKKRCGISGHNHNRPTSKTNYYQTTPICHSSKCCTSYRAKQNDTTSSTTVYTRPLKRRCACLTRNSRRTLPRGNSWWLPKLERVSKELCCKTRRHVEKIHDGWQSETSIDEARDFGYQSSASK